MHKKIISTFIFFCLFFLQATAISVPVDPVGRQVFGDSTISTAFNKEGTSAAANKPGFFKRLKNKMLLSLARKSLQKQNSDATKETLGYVSLGLLVLALGLFVFVSLSAGILVGLAALVTAIVGLAIKRDKKQGADGAKKESRGVRWGLIIPAILAGGGLIALFIALGSWGSH